MARRCAACSRCTRRLLPRTACSRADVHPQAATRLRRPPSDGFAAMPPFFLSRYNDGSMGMLHTVEAARRCGLAKLVVVELAAWLLSGQRPGDAASASAAAAAGVLLPPAAGSAASEAPLESAAATDAQHAPLPPCSGSRDIACAFIADAASSGAPNDSSGNSSRRQQTQDSVYSFVVVENTASAALMTSLGFKRHPEQWVWTGFSRSQQAPTPGAH